MKRTILTILFVLGMTTAASADIQVVANFDGGNGTATADSFAGAAGDGWAGGWQNIKNSATESASINGSVLASTDTGFNEVTAGGGNYLSSHVTGAGSAGWGRDFGGGVIDETQPYTISFSYRIDDGIESMVSSSNRIQFFNPNGWRATVDSESSWVIGTYGGLDSWIDAEDVGDWLFYDGAKDGSLDSARQINTGITVTEGVTYDFSVLVDPVNCSYSPTITDTNSGTTYSSTGLGWRTAATSMPTRLMFGNMLSSSNKTLDYSLDNIVLSQETANVPEPSTIVGLITLLLAGLVIKRRR